MSYLPAYGHLPSAPGERAKCEQHSQHADPGDEKINFAETQPKQFSLAEDGFYNSNKNNNITKETKKYNNNTYHHKGENNTNNYLNYNNDNKNNNNIIKQVKFRKLEKLPGDSDSGDVDLNDECI